jgi:hypothetical protein
MSLTGIASFLKHPLVLLVLGSVFTALLIPQVTRQWQDRQSEQEIKRSLLEEISTSATTAVRQANSLVTACVEPSSTPAKEKEIGAVCAPTGPTRQVRAAGGETGEDTAEIYAVLRNSWLIKRSAARSRIITYFPELYSCWYSYERALADYLGLVTQYPKSKKARVGSLEEYVGADFARVYTQPSALEKSCASLDDLPENVQIRFGELQEKLHWKALMYPTWHYRFKQEYAKLGEVLEIAVERIVITIVRAKAHGFSHGIDVPVL